MVWEEKVLNINHFDTREALMSSFRRSDELCGTLKVFAGQLSLKMAFRGLGVSVGEEA